MENNFKNPENRFRPIPFWSWNDKLDKDELEYQIKEMKKAGMGGFFMHARSGLKTPYLSEEWFDCIGTGIKSANEVGLDAWAYDEEGWPSGFAGGRVPELSEDYYAKFISLETARESSEIDWSRAIAAYVYNLRTNSYRRIDSDESISCGDGEELLVIIRHTNRFYIDTLNKRAVDAFLMTTHEEYYKRFGDSFGKSMKGFFTDEPRLTCDHFLDLAWSDDLPEKFSNKYGYDIFECIPDLYKETEDYKRVRYDFWTLVSEMFTTNYMKNIYDWCEAHDCNATGHIMMEESIFSQMTSTAGVMPFYEYLHIPGIDWLRRPISSPVVPKQVGSVACQLGKKQVLTETFALSGWDVSFEEMKILAEWQFVNGVNQICQHLESYTIKGVRKRDYPPSLFIQQTWWDKYSRFNDYLGRLCAALSEGDQEADVLLMHPMKSGYILYDGTRTDAIRKLDDNFTNINNTLTGLHISYHFGDETIISKYGSVNKDSFVVGRIPYKTVILPDMVAINGKTVELLVEFAQNGGNIFSIGEFPSYTNGDMEKLKKLREVTVDSDTNSIRKSMVEKNLLAVSMSENEKEIYDISFQQRNTEDGTILFFVNLSKTNSYQPELRIYNRHVLVEKLVPEDGSKAMLDSYFDGADTVVQLSFEPMQSELLSLKETATEPEHSLSVQKEYVAPSSTWMVKHMDLNSLTLDTCEYRIDDGEWEGPTAVILLQDKLLKLQRKCKVEMRFAFTLSANLLDMKELYVVIEDASLYNIKVNGKDIEAKEQGYWKDKSFKKVNIREAVISGENEIILSTSFSQPQKVYDVLFGENVYETEKNKITYDMEIENIYLLGDFGVVSKSDFNYGERKAMITNGPFEIVDSPRVLSSKNFTSQGLLFFAGTLELEQTLSIRKADNKRIILKLGRQKAPMIELYVNGVNVKNILWAPYEADITDAVVEGENEIRLKVYASNRNLFGPHHNTNGECYNVGPDSFLGRWSWVERTSEADATEIYDVDKNYWTDTYCFVEFGLE